jgi:hypothetical protein
MIRIIAALLLLQAMPAKPIVENDFVRVFKNSAPCAKATASCGERVVVALGPVEVSGQKLDRGDVKVFKAGERYSAPANGNYVEVAVNPAHPKVMPPSAGSPAPPRNKVLYDGKDFTVFEEKMAPGEYSSSHTHNVRLAIFLNRTNVEQWADEKAETRELIPDTVTWRPAVIHSSKDVGTVPIRNILIEFKP